MKRCFPIASTLLALLLAAPAAAFAQATGQITGLVTDASGAILPGVTVEATNAGTSATRTSVTGLDGLFTIPLLQPGNYTVKASLAVRGVAGFDERHFGHNHRGFRQPADLELKGQAGGFRDRDTHAIALLTAKALQRRLDVVVARLQQGERIEAVGATDRGSRDTRSSVGRFNGDAR